MRASAEVCVDVLRGDLFGEQLFAERVQGDELPGEDPSVDEALGHQHDLTDQLKVRHHHGTWPAGHSHNREAERKNK